jgi:hypothetical protein
MVRRINHFLSRLTLLSAVLILCTLYAAPAHAATVFTAQAVTISSSTPDNAYITAEQASVTAPLPADLCVAAGTLTVSAPVAGDVLWGGGSIDIQKPVAGDVREIGGRIMDEDTVGGDLIAAGGLVTVNGKAKDTRVLGETVQLLNGSNGNVVVYGADVFLSGEFNGNVEVVAADKVTLGEGTVIHGVLKYNAPEQADIPASAHIAGGVNYIGSAAWLPTVQQAKTFAVAGLWVFFLVKVTAALVATGLIAGLFPVFTDRVVEATVRRTPERFVLLTLLGFAGFVATPVLIFFLLVSFVGIGIALILMAAYALFLLLSYVYAGVLAGVAFMYVFRKHTRVSWRGALIGVLVLSVLGSIPIIGIVLKIVLCATAGGALLSIFYRFSFRRDPIDISSF